MSATSISVPETLAELLTPEWLNGALSTRFPGVNVTDVTPGPIVERVSTNARFKIEGDIPDGLPPALCAKGYFSEAGAGSRQAGVPEACFYRDLAHPIGVRTLNSVWADVDPATEHGVVITQDAVEAGAVFCDALDDCTVERVADQLGQFAKLHAYGWEQPEIVTSNPGLETRLQFILNVRGLKEISANFDGPNGVDVPDGTRTAQGLVDAYRQLAAHTPGPGWTIAHGDAHVGNTFIDGEGRGCLLDWQVIAVRAVVDRRRLPHRVGARARRAGGQRARPPAALPRRARRGRRHDRAVVGRRLGRVPQGCGARVLPLGHHRVRAPRGDRPVAAAARHRGRRARLLRTAGRHVAMTAASERERFEDLYDVERHVMATDGGILVEDPYPAFAELLDAAPVHEGLGARAARLRARRAQPVA